MDYEALLAAAKSDPAPADFTQRRLGFSECQIHDPADVELLEVDDALQYRVRLGPLHAATPWMRQFLRQYRGGHDSMLPPECEGIPCTREACRDARRLPREIEDQ